MSRRHTYLGTLIAILGILILGPPLLAQAPEEEARAEGQAEAACWDLGGTWMGQQDIGAVSLLTWIPLDPQGRRYSVQFELLNWEPTIGGLFPTAHAFTVFSGDAKRRKLRHFTWKAVSHGVDAQGTVLYTVMNRGTVDLVDCHNVQFGGTFGLYDVTQDPFTEEPLYGCYPMSPGSARRLTNWAGCSGSR